MGDNGYFQLGEFHYFRLPAGEWRPRLSQVKSAGLSGVSIYVPWNWHQPRPHILDFDGCTRPERNLLRVLDDIASLGLSCVFRPGPFITAEWLNGGLPGWLWELHPEILSLDSTGRPSNGAYSYPALTYNHPLYLDACTRWLEALIPIINRYASTRGGPVTNLQLDDEPSYWHTLGDPLKSDYNPVLVSGEGGPSRFARWVLERHGSLDAINKSYHMSIPSLEDLVPPREKMAERRELPRHVDWLEFKLDEIDLHVLLLHKVAREGGVDLPVSMLHPYLLYLNAAHFGDHARRNGVEIELTDESYLSLYGASLCPEHKVGHVISTHEAYRMWRGASPGTPVSIELQASNSSYLAPGAMELLYALTIARGIKGINYYMMVGGGNPEGHFGPTGRNYDISAAIGARGEERPHLPVIRKLSRLLGACGRFLEGAEPLRDVWLGCYAAYESAMLAGGDGVFSDAAWAMRELFSFGENGVSNTASLQSLLALAGVSYGYLDLERAPEEELRGARQIWVFCLDFMSRIVQERLVRYIEGGGHLVLLPTVPELDERMEPCDLLLRAIFEGGARPLFAGLQPDERGYTQIESRGGGSLVAAGRATVFSPPEGSEPLAWTGQDRGPCAFSRTVGRGRVAVLGFPLQYMPVSSADQFTFVTGIVEETTGPRAVASDSWQMPGFELAGAAGGLLCVVNPVELPGKASLSYTSPDGSGRLRLPLAMDGLRMPGRGARLLPLGLRLSDRLVLRHATWELVGIEATGEVTRLCFAAAPGEIGEIAFDGPLQGVEFTGGERIGAVAFSDRCTVVLARAGSEEVKLSLVS